MALQGALVGLFWFCHSADCPTVTGLELAAHPPAPTAASSGSKPFRDTSLALLLHLQRLCDMATKPRNRNPHLPAASPQPSLKGELRREVAGRKETRPQSDATVGYNLGKGHGINWGQ